MYHMQQLFAATIAAVILAGCANLPPNAAATAGPAKTAKDSTCLKDTGTRIFANNQGCSATGRSYSSDEISRTGAVTIGGALQLLDPSITVRQ